MAYTLNLTSGGVTYTIPITVLLKGNGSASNTASFIPSGGSAQTTFVSVIGATSNKIGPTVSGSVAVSADASGDATAHLDHFDFSSTSSNTFDNNDSSKGCGSTPVYVDIVAKSSDVSGVPAGEYTATIAFASSICDDVTTTTAGACTS